MTWRSISTCTRLTSRGRFMLNNPVSCDIVDKEAATAAEHEMNNYKSDENKYQIDKIAPEWTDPKQRMARTYSDMQKMRLRQ